jgi:hypothetical protein
MIRTIASTVFNAAVVVIAAALAVWLTISGYTLQFGGLLLGMGAIFGAVIFGFRLAEGFGPDRLSIWAGPGWIVRSGPALGASGDVPGRTA